MRNPQMCKRLLETILGVRIRKIEFVDNQESMEPDYEAKGIRLDVYVEDAEDTVYSVEMQTRNTGYLPQRTRYYQDVVDINLLEKGVSYKKLRNNLVIFICTFDLFHQGRHIYHFENLCREDPSIRLRDGSEKIFLNTKGTRNDVNEDLRNLLAYFDGKVPMDDFTKEIEAAVMTAKVHKEWRSEYMKMTLWKQDIMDEAKEEGMEEGLAEGRARGINEGEMKSMIKLVCKKIAKGKTKELAAEELETELDEIARIYDVAVKYAPDYDEEKIYEELTQA